jgi:hypothetical protein
MADKTGIKRQFKKRVRELLKEYIEEAEHQEGTGYWREYFSTVDEAIADFALFLDNVGDPDGSKKKKKRRGS